MRRRQPLPHIWMMTDERQGERLWAALQHVPRGAGVIFRHHGLPPGPRRALFERVRTLARRRDLVLLLAGTPSLASAWRADGSHGRGPRGRRSGLRSAPAHSIPEIRAAERSGANLLFVSPVFATRSHPGERPLGVLRFGRLARSARVPVIALGGMTKPRARQLRVFGIHGWAAIDAWTH
jgi:thiamine-phosphate pyrophosphorylase